MSNSGDLQQKLLQLASAGNGGAGTRTIRCRAGRSLLYSVLQELDNIVLPRKLVLIRPDQNQLTLVAANRCLIEFEGSTKERQCLDPQDEDQLSSIRTQLDSFLRGQDWISTRVEKSPKSFGARAGGVSARLLFAAWEVPSHAGEGNSPAETLGAFLLDNSDSMSVWCHDTGECVECGGDRSRFDEVQGQLQELMASFHGSGLCARKPDLENFFFVLDSEQSVSPALVACGLQDGRAAFQTEQGNAAILANKWASAPRSAELQD